MTEGRVFQISFLQAQVYWRGHFHKRFVNQIAGHIDKGNGYSSTTIARNDTNKRYQNHNLIWNYHYGLIPEGYTVNHKNNNFSARCRNKIEDLELATESQQNIHRKKGKNNTSGYKGIYWEERHQKWAARIWFRNKSKRLGLFKTKDEAITARIVAEKKYHK